METPTDLTIPEETIVEIGDFDRIPRMGMIEQQWETASIPPDELVDRSVDAVDSLDLDFIPAGGSIAVGVGSRGIANLSTIAAGVVEGLQDSGFEPFVVPAMGSHGGATDEGQRNVLETLGVTESTVGCPIRSSMNVIEVGRTPERNVSVVTDVHAANADAIIPVNRVKPHTDYDGAIESGLAKMLVIGFGKQRGAKIAHDWAIDWSLRRMVPSITDQLIESLPIPGGVAILEDQRDQTARIEGVPAETLLDRERELLQEAEELLPRLPFEEVDILVVDRQGKDISGQGIDPNVIGRRPFAINEGEPAVPNIKRIYVRSLSERTHGNAMGVGSADFVHQDVFREIDPRDTFVNAITASTVRGIRLPPVVETDRSGLLACLACIGVRTAEDVRILRVTDTMRLERMYASEALIEASRDREDLHVVEEPTDVTFTHTGRFEAPTPDADGHTLVRQDSD